MRRRLRRAEDPLARTFRDPAQRERTKLELAEVLEVCAQLADDYEQFEWFDAKSAAVRECAQVRVIVHRGCGSGVATPLSCHVRGEPDCERARMARLVERYDALVGAMARPVFWTFTERNVPTGELARGLTEQRRDFARLRRRAVFAGGRCRWRWPALGPDGTPDGTPGHPCHPPMPSPECRSPRCAPDCHSRIGEGHAPACDPGCPTRTGRHRSRCLVHPPREVHAGGCPTSCSHAGHRRDRNCPAFRHEPVPGGVSAVDVTWSEVGGGSWHPHLHALLDAPWIGWAEMRDTWQAITCATPRCRHGRSSRCTGAWSVWVEAVAADDPAERQAAIREVLKYVGKPHGIVDSGDPARIGEYLWATRHLKIVSGFGSLYRVQVAEDDPADADEITLHGSGFAVYHVPRICPNCGAATSEDDWLTPDRRPRLEAHRLPGGRYGWDPPPAGAA